MIRAIPARSASCDWVKPRATRKTRSGDVAGASYAAVLVMDTTAIKIERRTAPRHTSSSTAFTEPLTLVVGALDPIWQVLQPEHPCYAMFEWAHRWQESWGPNQHASYWSVHLRQFPRVAAKPSRTGLMASRAAFWLRDGYSQSQIATALGYGVGRAPKALWPRAKDYADWLENADVLVRQIKFQENLNGLELVAFHEQLVAVGVEVAGGRLRPEEAGLHVTTDPPMVDPDSENAAEEARRAVRRRWRTPRVVTTAEKALAPFGLPEPFSEGLLYTEVDRNHVAGAERALHQETPFHGKTMGKSVSHPGGF